MEIPAPRPHRHLRRPESVRKNMPSQGTELPVKLAKAYFKALEDLKKAENAIHDYLEEHGGL